MKRKRSDTTNDQDTTEQKASGESDPIMAMAMAAWTMMDPSPSSSSSHKEEASAQQPQRLAPVLIHDRNVALQEVQKSGGKAIAYLDPQLYWDRELVWTAVQSYGHALGYVSGHLPRYNKLHGQARSRRHALQLHNNPLVDDREIVLSALQNSAQNSHGNTSSSNTSSVLEFASGRLQGDKAIVMQAVKQAGHALRFASRTLRNDKQIVLAAVLNCGNTLMYASHNLQNDPEIVQTALATCRVPHLNKRTMPSMDSIPFSETYFLLQPSCMPLQFASDELCDDAETMLAALEASRGGHCREITRISSRLLHDKTFLWHAIHIGGGDIVLGKMAPDEEFANDPDLVKAARDHERFVNAKSKVNKNDDRQKANEAESNGFGIINPSKAQLCDKKLVIQSIQKWKKTHSSNALLLDFYEQLPSQLLSNREVVVAAMEAGAGSVLQCAPDSMRDDEHIVRQAIATMDKESFQYASQRIQADKAMVMEAVACHSDNVRYVSRELLLDQEFLSDLARRVRFEAQLKRLVHGDRRALVGGNPATAAAACCSKDDWVETLVQASCMFDPTQSVAALYYFLSSKPEMLLLG